MQVGAILDLYVDHLPLTIRQIYYRLVAEYNYEKTIKAYNNLVVLLTSARRARWSLINARLRGEPMLLFDAIRDDKAVVVEPYYYEDADHFIDGVRQQARFLRLDRQRGQPRRLALWCEASGMVPQLQRIANPYGIAVYSGKGFDIVTEKRRVPLRWAEHGEPVTLLHVGDQDPSGVHMFASLANDLIAYGAEEGAEDIEVCRIAILPHQTLGLPAALPNAEDVRTFDRMLLRASSYAAPEEISIDPTATWQAEALPPSELARIVTEAIEQRLDANEYEDVLALEREVRAQVLAQLDDGGDSC